jgi:hypothetical protein
MAIGVLGFEESCVEGFQLLHDYDPPSLLHIGERD